MEKTAQWLSQGGLGKPIEVLQTREPGGTQLGKNLRSLLLSDQSLHLNHRSELLLYAADRAQHVNQVLNPALEQGKIILCDRYIHSTTAYQGYGRGLDLQLIQQLNAIASAGLESDFTLWLDVAIETGLERVKKRGKRDRLEKADIAFHQRVRQGYEDLARQFPQQIFRIDANRSEPEVQSQIQTLLKTLVIGH
jgi:dTMP kinase